MRKQEFLDALKRKLSGLPKREITERLIFYNEMIDDIMEEGVSEEAAVSRIGCVDTIAEQIIAETPFLKIARERLKTQKQYKAWEIAFLVLGSPIWLSLAIAMVAVVFSLYVSFWSIIVSVWAVFISLIAGAFGGSIMSFVYVFIGKGATGFALLGISLICTGISALAFLGCKEVTKAMLLLTKKLALGIKKRFVKKEARDE